MEMDTQIEVEMDTLSSKRKTRFARFGKLEVRESKVRNTHAP